MGTYEGAAVALYTCFGIPLGNRNRDRSLLIGSKTKLDRSVLIALEGGYGKVVTVLAVDGIKDILYSVALPICTGATMTKIPACAQVRRIWMRCG